MITVCHQTLYMNQQNDKNTLSALCGYGLGKCSLCWIYLTVWYTFTHFIMRNKKNK